MSSTAMHSSLTDPEKLEVCPYDPNHQIRRCKMIVHLNRCKKNNPVAIKNSKKVKTCPFDATHVVPVIEFELHKKICPANNIQQDIIHEMESRERVDDMPIINHNITSSEDWECDQVVSAPFFLSGNPMIRLPNHVRNAPTVPSTTGDVHQLQQGVRDRQLPVTSSVNENVCHSVPLAPDVTQSIRLPGIGRGNPKLNGPPSLQPPPGFSQTQPRVATASAAFNVSMLSGKAAQVNVDVKPPRNHTDDTKLASTSTACVRAANRDDISEKLTIADNSLSATEVELDSQKELRKLRKKLKAIVQLEKDRENGKELNDDQRQKIASKGTIEEQMRSLQLEL